MILLCPGQGAQSVGMGRAWAQTSPAARAVFERADAVLTGDRAGWVGDEGSVSLSRLCFEGPAQTLSRTDVSQPAIFTASVASFHGVCDGLGLDPESAPLAAAAGLSLGEYTALHLAGAIGFEDALRLVALRGRAMQEAAEAGASGMVALIGADEATAEELCRRALERAGDGHGGPLVLVAANFNAPGQIVVSGSSPACDAAEGVAGEMGLRATRLVVAGAFHSPLMAPAADRLRAALERAAIRAPRCPVVSNVTGLPHDPDAGSIRARLVEQLTRPVRWAQGCGWLVSNILSGPAAGAVVELAPGRTLAGLMRRIEKQIKVVNHDVPQTDVPQTPGTPA